MAPTSDMAETPKYPMIGPCNWVEIDVPINGVVFRPVDDLAGATVSMVPGGEPLICEACYGVWIEDEGRWFVIDACACGKGPVRFWFEDGVIQFSDKCERCEG